MIKIKVLENRKCPICRSQIRLVETRNSNGILGPGHNSWITSTHGECVKQDCRVKVGVEENEPTIEIEQ